MKKSELEKIKRRVRELQKELGKLGPVMRGSVVVIGTRNKQPYFSLTKEGKTHLIYLGKNRVDKARDYLKNYKKLKKMVDEITQLNMILLKEDHEG